MCKGNTSRIIHLWKVETEISPETSIYIIMAVSCRHAGPPPQSIHACYQLPIPERVDPGRVRHAIYTDHGPLFGGRGKQGAISIPAEQRLEDARGPRGEHSIKGDGRWLIALFQRPITCNCAHTHASPLASCARQSHTPPWPEPADRIPSLDPSPGAMAAPEGWARSKWSVQPPPVFTGTSSVSVMLKHPGWKVAS
jgi:hypothetical protein